MDGTPHKTYKASPHKIFFEKFKTTENKSRLNSCYTFRKPQIIRRREIIRAFENTSIDKSISTSIPTSWIRATDDIDFSIQYYFLPHSTSPCPTKSKFHFCGGFFASTKKRQFHFSLETRQKINEY